MSTHVSVKEQVTREINNLSDDEIKQVAELYAEFADEDRELAEQGMNDYAIDLAKEDAR